MQGHAQLNTNDIDKTNNDINIKIRLFPFNHLAMQTQVEKKKNTKKNEKQTNNTDNITLAKTFLPHNILVCLCLNKCFKILCH